MRLTEILQQCGEIERYVAGVYRRFASGARSISTRLYGFATTTTRLSSSSPERGRPR